MVSFQTESGRRNGPSRVARRETEACQRLIERAARGASGNGRREDVAGKGKGLSRLKRPMEVWMRADEPVTCDAHLPGAHDAGAFADHARLQRRRNGRNLHHRARKNRRIERCGIDGARRVSVEIDREVGQALTLERRNRREGDECCDQDLSSARPHGLGHYRAPLAGESVRESDQMTSCSSVADRLPVEAVVAPFTVRCESAVPTARAYTFHTRQRTTRVQDQSLGCCRPYGCR